jgi:oligopeptide/dipeptide ABC transporter ATP-binding protein
LLDVRGLTTVFDTGDGPLAAVNQVDLRIHPGETLGLVGESGCGKTMLAYSLLRLVPPPGRIAGGQVVFKGRDLLGLSDQEIRRVRGREIGLVFQEPGAALNPVMRVGDQVAEPLRVHLRLSRSEARARVVELLRNVSIADPERRIRDYPHEMSGGMKQRVLIAAAIACSPDLLIADEPTTALDVTVQAQVLRLLARLKEDYRLAMLLVSHDLGVVAENADRVAVMYAGRIVEEAPVGAIFRDPKHPYTRALLRSIPRPRGNREGSVRLSAIEGSVPNLARLPSGCAFASRCPVRFEPCTGDVPLLTEVAPEHRAACYLHEPVLARGAAP